MQTDVSSASLAASAQVTINRTRVKGIVIIPGSTAGSVTLLDGTSTGVSKINIATPANGQGYTVDIPGEGVVFTNGVYASLSNASIVVFYG
jgi:hypothetical protein